MAKANARRWKLSQSTHSIGFFCPGVGTFWAAIKSGRSARIHRFISNLFTVRPTHPRYERFCRGWTARLDPRYGDQEKRYGGIKFLTLKDPTLGGPGVVLEFIRKIPPMLLIEDLERELEMPKPEPKRERKPRKKTSSKGEAKASKVEAKTEKPEGDNAPEAQEKNDV